MDTNKELMTLEDLAQFQRDILRPALVMAVEIIQSIEDNFDKPRLIELGGHPVYRYENPKLEHIVIQRLYRQVSGLKASYVLLNQGHIQEIGVLLRTVNEFQQDVTFLLENYGKQLSENQQLFINEVLKEGYIDITLPWLGAMPRAMVSRNKIIASVARSFGEVSNPSDAKKLAELDTDIFSSFVHGAYPAIMDIYGPSRNGLKYHPFGILTDHIIYTWVQQIIIYSERLVLGLCFVAHTFGFEGDFKKAYALKNIFQSKTPTYGHDLSELDKGSMARLKKGKPIEKPSKSKSKPKNKERD